jgi:glyoxylase-like metal-dependent hydrolase (beta-lactamase superfamily II)
MRRIVPVVFVGLALAVGALALRDARLAAQTPVVSQDDKAVNIQYMPSLSNEKRLKDPLGSQYSTLYLLTGNGANAVAFVVDDAVVLVNAKTAGAGPKILDKLNLMTDLPVTTIINTSPDAEYTGANGEFASAKTIIAHDGAKAAMAKAGVTKALPNKTFSDKLSLLNDRAKIDLYYFGAGHTNGDTVVVFSGFGVAYVGELFPGKRLPTIDTKNGGSAVAFPDTLAKMYAQLKDTVDSGLVPGRMSMTQRGFQARVLSMRDLQEYIDFNRDFLTAAKAAMAAGKSVDEAAASLKMPEKYAAYDMQNAKANIQAIYDELKKK